MKIEIYNEAKYIQEHLSKLRTKKLQIEVLKKRDKDEEFNQLRELAIDAIRYAISRLEKDFEAL